MTVAVARSHRWRSIAATAAHFSRAAVSPGRPEREGRGGGSYLEVENRDGVPEIPEIKKPGLRERGHGAEVLVDVEHGGV